MSVKKEEEKVKLNSTVATPKSNSTSQVNTQNNTPKQIISSGANKNLVTGNNMLTNYNQQYGQNVQSQAVTDAYNKYNTVLGQKPIEEANPFSTQLNDIVNKIMNREAFEYDLNADMLYQQAKDQYTALGKMAMQDTMGQAAALTGGYGNSYANTAGYQAYQGYLQDLNNNLPEYYQMALDRYNQEGADMLNKYSMTKGLYDTEYGKYRDQVGDWYNDVNNAYNEYANTQNLDFNSYSKAQDLEYQVGRDNATDKKWKDDYSLNERQVTLAENELDFEKDKYDDAKNAQSEQEKAANNATDAAKASGVLSASELYKFEEYLEEGNVAGIERHLDSLVEGGALDAGYASYVLSLFLPDEEVDTSMKPSTGPSAPMGAKRLAKTQVDGTYATDYILNVDESKPITRKYFT